jgi:DivIVA domain-containing protein
MPTRRTAGVSDPVTAPLPRADSGKPSADRIREHHFTTAKRGYSTTEVRAYLATVADEVTRLLATLAAARDENARIKDALHIWQREHAHTCTQAPSRPSPTPSWRADYDTVERPSIRPRSSRDAWRGAYPGAATS